jgi:putative photosynthetic complex assembly protein 2
MAEHGLAFLLAILAWWLSTAVILVVCALPQRTFRVSFAAASLIAVAAVYGFVRSAWNTDMAGAYVGFASALAIWGWIEMSFLMGFITGPRTAPCPQSATGWIRFRLALQTLLYHELTIAGAAVLLVALSWGAPNQTGTLAFLILMVMRISAKLNIFLGVPNLTDEFLPQRLDYLKSYFRKRQSNAFFPVSVAAAAWTSMVLAQKALAADGAAAGGYALLFTLTALAILEHVFMVLPLPDAALWRWAMPASHAKSIDKPMP